MNTLWIVSANAGQAHFFSREKPSASVEKVGQLFNEKVSMLTSQTESDRIGQHAASKSEHSVGRPTQPSGYQPNQTPAQHHMELFARHICRFLLHGYQDGQYQQLAIIASPEFLGVLRSLLDPRLAVVIAVEINKDYTHCTALELGEYIHAQMAA